MNKLARVLSGFFGRLSTLWLILGITLVLVVLLEGSLRIAKRIKRGNERAAIAARSGFHDAEWAPEYVDELWQSIGVRWQPYVHLRGRPFAGSYITIDSDGFRATPQAEPAGASTADAATERTTTIWMFGGSVVWGWGSRDGHTIPAELARELAAAGYAVEVSNFGQIGYVSTQEVLALYCELRTGRRPDVVVLLSGYNDLMAALQEGVAGLPQNENNRRAEFNIRLPGALAAAVRRSATMWLVKGLRRRAGIGLDARQSFGGADRPTLESLGGDVLSVYAANVQLIEQLRPVYGFEVLYYWQPSLYGKEELIGEEATFAKTFPPMKELLGHVRAGFGTTTPLDGSAPFRDLTGLFDDSSEAVFIDTAHFSEDANRVVAREIARDLTPILEARAPASSSNTE